MNYFVSNLKWQEYDLSHYKRTNFVVNFLMMYYYLITDYINLVFSANSTRQWIQDLISLSNIIASLRTRQRIKKWSFLKLRCDERFTHAFKTLVATQLNSYLKSNSENDLFFSFYSHTSILRQESSWVLLWESNGDLLWF